MVWHTVHTTISTIILRQQYMSVFTFCFTFCFALTYRNTVPVLKTKMTIRTVFCKHNCLLIVKGEKLVEGAKSSLCQHVCKSFLLFFSWPLIPLLGQGEGCCGSYLSIWGFSTLLKGILAITWRCSGPWHLSFYQPTGAWNRSPPLLSLIPMQYILYWSNNFIVVIYIVNLCIFCRCSVTTTNYI